MDIGNLQGTANVAQAKAQVVKLKPADNLQPQAGVAAQRAEQQESSNQQASREQVDKAVESISDFVQSVRRNINFSVDDTSGRIVVKVIDTESGDLVRQIPSEEALALAENLNSAGSVLFEAKA
ncbi:flagellar protein FlaG [Atopomonas sediminilitoris]|uniref:flagellar protein FlaG n=1 Tax=Atopomonas sediminilitoris TaxID=2919919 RepID=UPI001F4E34AB|nr:flagellar protein FlaG [Atopomonas sediminilitoris]MCJ8167960.1 flagellar protein FlaG [Atopomonas sediminilitoris]